MNADTGRRLGVMRHRQVAHDIVLMCSLLDHHTLLLFAIYDPETRQQNPLSIQARKAVDELFKFKKSLHEQAKIEHPGADFLNQYEDASCMDAACWPPRITAEKEVVA